MMSKTATDMNKSKRRLTEILIFCVVICTGFSAAGAVTITTPDGYASGTTGGGQAIPVTVTTADAFKSAVKNDQPAVIIVKGRLDVGNVRVRSNKTIIGEDSGSGLFGGHVKVTGDNCIFQNLIFGPSEVDAVELSGATRIFIHKCEFYDGGDGLLDIVRMSDYITVSWCKFYYVNQTEHNQVTLVGNGRKEDAGKLHVTLHHNWYAQRCHSVMPFVRYGQVHIYNNYYSSAESEFCIGIGAHSRIRVENTCFDHVRGAWEDLDGIANDGQMGRDGLKMVNTSTPLFAPNLFPVFTLPYSYSMDPVDQVKDKVTAGAGNVFDSDIGGSEGVDGADHGRAGDIK
jgi:pectate lyase